MHVSVLSWQLFLFLPTVMSLPSSRQAPIQSVTGASGSLTAYDSRRAIPGDSPAYCVGDPSQKILSIETLNLVPNPPIE